MQFWHVTETVLKIAAHLQDPHLPDLTAAVSVSATSCVQRGWLQARGVGSKLHTALPTLETCSSRMWKILSVLSWGWDHAIQGVFRSTLTIVSDY
jgi:hypothetical protein